MAKVQVQEQPSTGTAVQYAEATFSQGPDGFAWIRTRKEYVKKDEIIAVSKAGKPFAMRPVHIMPPSSDGTCYVLAAFPPKLEKVKGPTIRDTVQSFQNSIPHMIALAVTEALAAREAKK